MARIARKDLEAPYTHILVQGIGFEEIFSSDECKESYLAGLKRAAERIDCSVLGYCIMNNHAHLLLCADSQSDLSRFMQFINTEYAKFYNHLSDRTGYVFKDRFKSEGISSTKYLVNCLIFIHNNPVTASIVDRAEDYRFSSYSDYLSHSGAVDFKRAAKFFDPSANGMRAIMREKSETEWIDCDDKPREDKWEKLEGLKVKHGIEDNNLNDEKLKEFAIEIHESCGTSYREIAAMLEVNREKLRRLVSPPLARKAITVQKPADSAQNNKTEPRRIADLPPLNAKIPPINSAEAREKIEELIRDIFEDSETNVTDNNGNDTVKHNILEITNHIPPTLADNANANTISAKPAEADNNIIIPKPIIATTVNTNTIAAKPTTADGTNNNTIIPKPIIATTVNTNTISTKPSAADGTNNNINSPKVFTVTTVNNNPASIQSNVWGKTNNNQAGYNSNPQQSGNEPQKETRKEGLKFEPVFPKIPKREAPNKPEIKPMFTSAKTVAVDPRQSFTEYEDRWEKLDKLVKKYNITSKNLSDEMLKVLALELHQSSGASYDIISGMLDVPYERISEVLCLTRK